MPSTYTITEFEQETGISPHTLRYFDKVGLLKAQRSSNGYRIYDLSQIAIAKMILTLQKSKLSNAEIQALLSSYNSASTIDKLKQSYQNLAQEIHELQQAYMQLGNHITDLEIIWQVRQQLDQPFIADSKQWQVGTLALDTPNILHFFEQIEVSSGDNFWYLKHKYGFILEKSQIRPGSYPLITMYNYEPNLLKSSPLSIASGRYMCMYSAGSLENNPKVHFLLKHAHECGYQTGDKIYIENVSGPVIDQAKSDFLIKIMIPIYRKTVNE